MNQNLWSSDAGTTKDRIVTTLTYLSCTFLKKGQY